MDASCILGMLLSTTPLTIACAPFSRATRSWLAFARAVDGAFYLRPEEPSRIMLPLAGPRAFLSRGSDLRLRSSRCARLLPLVLIRGLRSERTHSVAHGSRATHLSFIMVARDGSVAGLKSVFVSLFGRCALWADPSSEEQQVPKSLRCEL